MTEAPLDRPRWGDAVLLMLCQSSQALIIGGLALFLPIIREDLGLSFTQAGSLAAASTLVYALMQIPSGYLADRAGPKRLFLIGLAGTNLLALVFAILGDYWAAVANQAVSGFFRALVFAPGLLLIAAAFPPSRRATAMGLYVAGGFSSNILLNLVGPVLLDPLGWRWLFAVFAVLGLAMLVVFWRLSPEEPRRSSEAPVPIRTALRLFRHPVMWIIGAIQYIRLAVVLGLGAWLPTFIVEDKGFSLQVAGLVVALGAVLTAPSNFLGGYVSDRLGRPLLVIGGSLVMLGITTALLPHVHGIAALLAIVALNGVFLQFYFGPLFAVPIEMLGPRTAGLTSGFSNFFA
ncbi:MAG: transporter, family, D-galactonate transporter, partial [Solirubrobacteraceae bacterium]|nr:transporter, family, D-galactonate transporter [Solirubrobacteraceae bacterium]